MPDSRALSEAVRSAGAADPSDLDVQRAGLAGPWSAWRERGA